MHFFKKHTVSFSLLILAVVSLGYLNWQLYRAETQAIPIATKPSKAISTEISQQTQYKPFAPKPLQVYEIIVQRPVFRENRKPVQKRSAKPVARKPVVQKPRLPGSQRSVLIRLQLLGIRLQNAEQAALIQSATRKQGLWKRTGEKIDGWTIESIKFDSVILHKGGTYKTLKLYKEGKTQQKN
ncbi:MAG: type II secretion system protein N [Pseudomonadota bacterium]